MYVESFTPIWLEDVGQGEIFSAHGSKFMKTTKLSTQGTKVWCVNMATGDLETFVVDMKVDQIFPTARLTLAIIAVGATA